MVYFWNGRIQNMDPRSMGHHCGPSPWTSFWTRSMDSLRGPLLIFEGEFLPEVQTNGRNFVNLYYQDWRLHMLNFFLNSIHGFGLVWKEKLFEGNMRRRREEVFTYEAFLCHRVAWRSTCIRPFDTVAGRTKLEVIFTSSVSFILPCSRQPSVQCFGAEWASET